MRGEYSLSDIAAATGNNGGFGGNGDWAWIIILFILFGYGRNGFGGSGANDNYVLTSDFAQLSKQISDTYNMTDRKFDGLSNGICNLGYTQAQLINGIDKSILTTTNNISSQLADVGFGIKDCCCQQLRAIDSVNFNNAQNTCAITNAINGGLKDVMINCNNNYQKLHEEIVSNKLEMKNERIAEQQNEINALRLAASQERQNNYLVEKLQFPKCPVPSYTVANPYCNCNNGCGCGM